MLLTREEMTFDFGGSKLDPVRDKELLGWMLNQFLYGEVTGIQCGHWLYGAPSVEAARFIARQSVEEFQHVDNFLKIMGMIGVQPGKPHGMVKFLSTGMMGSDWAEHVALEMAAGEGFVLMAFYSVIDTLDLPEAVAILTRAVKQEERHVEFGEQQTMKAIEGKPWLRRRLVGLNLVSMWGVSRLAGFMQKRLPADHEVLKHLPGFLAKCNENAERRMLRMGLIDKPLAEMGGFKRKALVAEAYGGKALGSLFDVVKFPFKLLLPFLFRQKRLTDHYLSDPAIRVPQIETSAKATNGAAKNGAAKAPAASEAANEDSEEHLDVA